MPRSIFKEGKKYTFSDYFEMNNSTEEIVNELGYSFSLYNFNFPMSKEIEHNLIDSLRSSYYELLPKVSLNSEVAKRELMIAPLLHSVIRQIEARLLIEYSIEIDEKLSGTIDYLLRSQQELIVIEAKKGDLEKGFNQLAAEMIAADKYEESDFPPCLYGALSIGEVWRFAVLKRQQKTLIKDVHIYRFPEDVVDIFAILKGILTS